MRPVVYVFDRLIITLSEVCIMQVAFRRSAVDGGPQVLSMTSYGVTGCRNRLLQRCLDRIVMSNTMVLQCTSLLSAGFTHGCSVLSALPLFDNWLIFLVYFMDSYKSLFS
jgi:hypothetical protein